MLGQPGGGPAPEPRLLTLSPFDASQISNIEKAIQASDLGTTITNLATADSDQTEPDTDTVWLAVHHGPAGRGA